MDFKVKSLEKALRILECFSVKQPELGITEICNLLELNKSNVHNIVSTFEKKGYIDKNTETGKYRLGLNIMRLSHVLSASMVFHNEIHRCLNELSVAVDETVYFGIRNENKVMYLYAAFPEKAFNTRWVQGMTAPLVSTGIGKAILANMDNEYIESLLTEPLVQYTDYTITDPALMREELELIRQRGYSIDNMENEFGVKCVGVPIFDQFGRIIGAFSASGPSLRFCEVNSAKFARILKEKADMLGRRW